MEPRRTLEQLRAETDTIVALATSLSPLNFHFFYRMLAIRYRPWAFKANITNSVN